MAVLRVIRADRRPRRTVTEGCRVVDLASSAASERTRQGGWALQLVDLAASGSWSAPPGTIGADLAGTAVTDAVLAASETQQGPRTQNAPRAQHGAADQNVLRPQSGLAAPIVGRTLTARSPSRVVALTIDPGRAQGSLDALSAGDHDLVGLSWFVVARVALTVRINDGESALLDAADAARITLRSQPISRLTLIPVGAQTSEREQSGPEPVAFLAAVAR